MLFTKDINAGDKIVEQEMKIKYTRLYSPKSAFRSKVGQGKVIIKNYSDFIKDKAKLPIHQY